jgi:uncharacterized membrane protein YhaH (DUF805 family)
MIQNPFSFKGRIRRTEYGISFIIYAIFAIAIYLDIKEGVLYPAFFLIPLLWFFLAQGVKRCHDRGNSGWFQIIPFYVLWLIFAEGDNRPNEYGLNPKAIEIQESNQQENIPLSQESGPC